MSFTIRNELEKINIEPLCTFNTPLKELTAFKIGGPAEIICRPVNVKQVKQLIRLCQDQCLPLTIAGKLSNVLIPDQGIPGMLLLTDNFVDYSIEGTLLVAQCGFLVDTMIELAWQNHLTGLEALSGLPGTIGGAVYGNAGAHGLDIGDLVEYVEFLTPSGELRQLGHGELDFTYKHSFFTSQQSFIYRVALRLRELVHLAEAQALRSKVLSERHNRGHYRYPSAGSMFKNPPGYTAGALIEQVGLKGFSIGGASISTTHANFFLNCEGKATSSEITELTQFVEQRVFERFGIRLEREVIFIPAR